MALCLHEAPQIHDSIRLYGLVKRNYICGEEHLKCFRSYFLVWLGIRLRSCFEAYEQRV